MKRSHVFTAAITALLAVCSTSFEVRAQEPKAITFLTNYVYNGRHAPFFVGLEKGFYKDAGFDIRIAPATGSGFVLTAVDSGQADFGMADVSSVVQSVAKGAKVKAFMVYTDVTTNGLASLTPYPTPDTVVGKKIAASHTDSVRVILPIIFDEHKLDISKIDWQAADPGVYFSLLLSGQVDLITASSDGDMPALSKVAAAQGKSVEFAGFDRWGYDIFGYVLVTDNARIEKDPSELKRFSDATKKAVDYAIAHPEETADIMVKYNPTMDRDTVLAQWSGTIASMQTPYAKEHGYGVATDERIQRSIDLVKKAMKLDVAMTPDDLFALKGH
ncbi:ABC transporter substrate-binding protein [Rhodoligotrophos defluvii]|uniref:ABC transporter substrate-binding protein n=1 Tax=Rhodoligotrophos defluvii TaxID=2561934 RepID=UPI001485A6F2|nr:ABC transporter substrate-binding protein [Rhodoligotrophos defluvii]